MSKTKCLYYHMCMVLFIGREAFSCENERLSKIKRKILSLLRVLWGPKSWPSFTSQDTREGRTQFQKATIGWIKHLDTLK